uniref:Uncharacterized protein n=1 Tax=Anguilla anguilla TaxID=7936 RepID=A0A0E9R3M2_ANGAN
MRFYLPYDYIIFIQNVLPSALFIFW